MNYYGDGYNNILHMTWFLKRFFCYLTHFNEQSISLHAHEVKDANIRAFASASFVKVSKNGRPFVSQLHEGVPHGTSQDVGQDLQG